MTELKGSGQSRSASLPVDTLLSDYRIVKKLASRGFSSVYLTTDEHGTPVATKEYLPSLLAHRAPGELIPIVPRESMSMFCLGLEYFFEEGRSSAKISHPTIVHMLSLFREDGTVCMVMTYEQGKALQEHILVACQQSKLEMLRERFIYQVFHDLVSGLRGVHIHELLHFDIKPGNIYPREDFSPILLDFGTVRQILTAEASCSQPMHTPGFAISGLYRKHNELGPWTDIYNIGATIYVCMAGTLPREAMQCEKDDKLEESLERLRKVYIAGLVDLVGWCPKIKPEECPQSVLRLQKVLREESSALTELQALTAVTQGGSVPEGKEALTMRFMSRLLHRRDS